MSIPDHRGKALNEKVQRHSDGSRELWRDVLGHKGLYRVSDRGRVKSLDRTIVRRGRLTKIRGIMLNMTADKRGRMRVNICKNGKRRGFGVHRLVLEAFVGPCPEGMECCHFPDRNPSNNCLENVRWDTKRENTLDSIKHGTFHLNLTDAARIKGKGMGGRARWAKLTPKERSEIASKRARMRWANATPEQRREVILKVWKTRRQKQKDEQH